VSTSTRRHAALVLPLTLALARPRAPFVALGCDPTAGAWAQAMERGDKPMPSVALRWQGGRFRFLGLALHVENASLWQRCRALRAALVGLDGPCSTRGLRLRTDLRGWDLSARGGVRDGEVALRRAGLGLFWTTHATVARFDGASRWIARSLLLFAGRAPAPRIEVYPHGVFALLWRTSAGAVPLRAKATPRGRAQRLSMLRQLIDGLSPRALPDHDAVDACAAALAAGLHRLGLARAYGTEAGGGRIWLPDAERLLARPPGLARGAA
jgi:hypothetical protein